MDCDHDTTSDDDWDGGSEVGSDWDDDVFVEDAITTRKRVIQEARDEMIRDARADPSAAARTFAIPELLEQILLELNLHSENDVSVINIRAKQLCRLEMVNHDFRTTIRGSEKLLESREYLQLRNTPAKYVAVIALLRELGYDDFEVTVCQDYECPKHSLSNKSPAVVMAVPCHRTERDLFTLGFDALPKTTESEPVCKCGSKRLRVKSLPDRDSAVEHKQRFEKATDCKWHAWRDLKIGKPFTIVFERKDSHYHVEVAERTLGDMWTVWRRSL